MLQNIEIILVASYANGKPVAPHEFLDQLGSIPFESYGSTDVWESARIIFLKEKFEDFRGEIDASMVLDAHLASKIGDATNWLCKIPTSIFDSFKKNDLQIKLIIDMWIDQNQIDLELSPDFLFACGERKIPICFITNA